MGISGAIAVISWMGVNILPITAAVLTAIAWFSGIESFFWNFFAWIAVNILAGLIWVLNVFFGLFSFFSTTGAEHLLFRYDPSTGALNFDFLSSGSMLSFVYISIFGISMSLMMLFLVLSSARSISKLEQNKGNGILTSTITAVGGMTSITFVPLLSVAMLSFVNALSSVLVDSPGDPLTDHDTDQVLPTYSESIDEIASSQKLFDDIALFHDIPSSSFRSITLDLNDVYLPTTTDPSPISASQDILPEGWSTYKSIILTEPEPFQYLSSKTMSDFISLNKPQFTFQNSSDISVTSEIDFFTHRPNTSYMDLFVNYFNNSPINPSMDDFSNSQVHLSNFLNSFSLELPDTTSIDYLDTDSAQTEMIEDLESYSSLVNKLSKDKSASNSVALSNFQTLTLTPRISELSQTIDYYKLFDNSIPSSPDYSSLVLEEYFTYLSEFTNVDGDYANHELMSESLYKMSFFTLLENIPHISSNEKILGVKDPSSDTLPSPSVPSEPGSLPIYNEITSIQELHNQLSLVANGDPNATLYSGRQVSPINLSISQSYLPPNPLTDAFWQLATGRQQGEVSYEFNFIDWDVATKGSGTLFTAIIAIMLAKKAIIIMYGFVLLAAKRIYEIGTLFLFSPIPVAFSPLDEGAKVKTWLETYYSKIIIVAFLMLSMTAFNVILIEGNSFIMSSGEGIFTASPETAGGISFFRLFAVALFSQAGLMAVESSATLMGRTISASATIDSSSLAGNGGVFGKMTSGISAKMGAKSKQYADSAWKTSKNGMKGTLSNIYHRDERPPKGYTRSERKKEFKNISNNTKFWQKGERYRQQRKWLDKKSAEASPLSAQLIDVKSRAYAEINGNSDLTTLQKMSQKYKFGQQSRAQLLAKDQLYNDQRNLYTKDEKE